MCKFESKRDLVESLSPCTVPTDPHMVELPRNLVLRDGHLGTVANHRLRDSPKTQLVSTWTKTKLKTSEQLKSKVQACKVLLHTQEQVHSCLGTAATHMSYEITQFYLPPGWGDVPAIPTVEVGTWFIDPRMMVSWVDLSHLVYLAQGYYVMCDEQKEVA